MHLANLTHVHYAFFDLSSSCQVQSLDAWADFDKIHPQVGMNWGTPPDERGNVGAFAMLKQTFPHLHVAMSIGGWSKSTYFSHCAALASRRNTLVATAVAMLERTGFDGIDVDWEFPGAC